MLETWAVVPRCCRSRRDARTVSVLSGEQVLGRQADGQGRGPGEVLAAVETAQLHARLAGQLLDDVCVLVELLLARGTDTDERDVAHLGEAGHELLLAIEQGLRGPAVAGVDAPSLVLLGGRVGFELHQVALDRAP